MKNKRNRGAASVLVVFLMLVLVTLGAFAIASANANVRLSRRAQAWNEMYYALDAQGEAYLAEIDGWLVKAEVSALEYIYEKKWENEADTAAQAEMTALSEAAANSSDFTALFNRVYLRYANEYLTELAFDGQNLNVYSINDDNKGINGLSVQFSFISDIDTDCGMEIIFRVAPAKQAKVLDENWEIRWGNGTRYNIEDWHEFQILTEGYAPIEAWDGTF
jgi:hypothetical protein